MDTPKEPLNIKCIAIVEDEESGFDGTLKLERNDDLLELYKKRYIIPGDTIRVSNRNDQEITKYVHSAKLSTRKELFDYITANHVWGEFKVCSIEFADKYIIIYLMEILSELVTEMTIKNGDFIYISVNANNSYSEDSKVEIKD